jgi:hypothetical protein
MIPILHRSRRRGRIVPLMLFALSLLLVAFAVAVNLYMLATFRAEMQAAADAAADAGAAALVGDDLLRDDPAAMPALIDNARAAAVDFAGRNKVNAQPFVLQPNPTNDPTGDITFGTLDKPHGSTFVLPGDTNDPGNPALPAVNAVRILAQRTRARGNTFNLLLTPFTGVAAMDVQVASTVMLDRDVIGFRPTENPLFLAPLALFSDPSGADTRSWDYQITAHHAPDAFRFDPPTQSFIAGSDGLGEFPASLATDAGQVGTTNVALLNLGVTDMAGRINQLQNGITTAQLSAFGGELVLGPADNRLTVPGTEHGPGVGGTDLDDLHQALDQLRQAAAVRIWPLYSGTDGSGNPILCGFVAGRVVTVTAPAAGQPFWFSIQPTMVSVGSAVTDAARRGVGGIAITNPYICKVRFVE